MAEWVKVDSSRRKQRQLPYQLRDSEESSKSVDKLEDKLVKEDYQRSTDIRNLIGNPVIRRHVHTDSHQLATQEESQDKKRGGLLHIPHTVLAEHTDSFDFRNEAWPKIDNIPAVEEGIQSNVGESGFAWSNVVKQPPPPKIPVLIQNERPDVFTSKEPLESDTDEPKRKKKKKKKEKEKLPETQTLDLGALIDALTPSHKSPVSVEQSSLKKTPVSAGKMTTPSSSTRGKKHDATSNPRNVLDSSAPSVRRGKEKETPKRKKLTPMKKTIMKEREERKKARESGQAIPSIFDVQNASSKSPVVQSLHNRNFREYCTHMISPELNNTVQSLLSDLVRFQDRVYKNEPVKLKTKRRYVCGLKEVMKLLELKKLRVVIVAPNLDRIESPGGINNSVEKIIQLCNQYEVAVVFALSRRSLAYVLRKKFKIGCVGIISFAGAEDKFKKMSQLVAAATKEYQSKRDNLLLTPTTINSPTTINTPLMEADVEASDDTIPSDGDEEYEHDDEDSSDENDDNDHNDDSIPQSQWDHLFSTTSTTATTASSGCGSAIPVLITNESSSFITQSSNVPSTAEVTPVTTSNNLTIDNDYLMTTKHHYDESLGHSSQESMESKSKDSSDFGWNLSAAPFIPTLH